LPKKSAVQFVHARFIIGIVVGVSWFTLTFEAIGAESRGPDFSTLSRDSSVRVGGKLATLVQEGYSAFRSKHYDRAISSFTAALQADPDKNIAFSFIFTARGLMPTKTIR
jgi:hypothetical protein